MARKFDLPGTDQTVDFSGGVGNGLKDIVMVFVSFVMVIGIGRAALWAYNEYVAPNTPDQFSEIEGV